MVGGYGVERHDPDRFALYVLDTAPAALSSAFSKNCAKSGASSILPIRTIRAFTRRVSSPFTQGQARSTLTPSSRSFTNSAVKSREGIGGEAAASQRADGNLMLSLESTANRMSRIGKAELFEEELLTPDELMARIDAVTHEDTMRVAARVLNGTPCHSPPSDASERLERPGMVRSHRIRD